MTQFLNDPIKNPAVSQPFGGNANNWYANHTLKGHPGIDMVSYHDEPILAACDGYIYKKINKDNQDLSKYRAVCQIVENENGVFEIVYGHCNQINCQQGDVTNGTQVATEGNTGDVYVGGNIVPVDVKLVTPFPGTHLHFQLRAVEKILDTFAIDVNSQYLSDELDASKPFQKDGFYFRVLDWNNGYNGCVDPEPYRTHTYAGDKVVTYTSRPILTDNQKIDILKKIVSLYQQVINLIKKPQ